jgi:hypothetical protein
VCSGTGKDCDYCKEGVFSLSECPRRYVGVELTQAINYASLAIKGQWPVLGGVLDQSAWFVDLVQSLDSEQNAIDAERAERLYG